MSYKVNFDLELKKNEYGGLYIAFEGIDGSGKTTQLDYLYQYFEDQGKDVVKVKEPTREGPIGELIHKVLQKKIIVPRVAFQYLLAADRQVQLETTIIPALKEGKIVISDRCFWSSIPYGLADVSGYNSKDVKLVALSILSMYHQFVKPDFVFYLDISVDVAVKRLSQTDKTQEIYEKKSELGKIYKGYQLLLEEFGKEIIVVDGTKEVGKITESIINNIKKS